MANIKGGKLVEVQSALRILNLKKWTLLIECDVKFQALIITHSKFCIAISHAFITNDFYD
jgi:hypothetical protein